MEPLYRSSIPYHQNKEIWDTNVLRERMVWRKQRDDLCHFHWALFCIDHLYLAKRTKIYGTEQQCPQRKGGVAQAEMTGGSFSSVGRSATSTQAEVSTLGWGRGRGRPSRGRRGRTCASQLDSVDQGIGFTRKSHNMREALCRDSYCEEEVDIACKWRATC